MSADWIAVACHEHVSRGVDLGIMQICHGKAAPLRRIAPGDRVVYYSPTEAFGGSARLQSFTALGVVLDGEAYQVEMGRGFRPFRRAVRYLKVRPVPIQGLLGKPGFTLNGKRWGARLRYGLLRIDGPSFDMIAAAMGADLSPAPAGSAARDGVRPPRYLRRSKSPPLGETPRFRD